MKGRITEKELENSKKANFQEIFQEFDRKTATLTRRQWVQQRRSELQTELESIWQAGVVSLKVRKWFAIISSYIF